VRFDQLGRLCAAGELAAGFAHELQQPLCSIAIYADTCLRLLNDPGFDRSVLQDALGDVRREATRAATVIKQLRRFVLRRAPAVRLVRIGPIVDRALAMTDYEAKHRGVAIRVRIDALLPSVLVEPVQIEQVVYNLVRNALDAIAAHRSPSPELVIEARLRGGGWLEVDVDNPGGPVPERIRKQMFEPFFSTKRDRLGVGLYLARAIVAAHRGTIECLSNTERTTLRFTLPIAPSNRKRVPTP
jgi:signal transduction histidine kinase